MNARTLKVQQDLSGSLRTFLDLNYIYQDF